MKILSINRNIKHNKLSIENITFSKLATLSNIEDYSYIIINGGDGTIRRVIKILHNINSNIPIILNPTGSFNVIAKLHHTQSLKTILENISNGKTIKTNIQKYYSINNDIFLFSAGNMGDLQHIFLSETLRFGLLKNGISKYILALLFLLPIHFIMTPFMLMSSKRFFIFTPTSYISKFGSFRGKITKEFTVDLENDYNLIELDGDIVTIKESSLTIQPAGNLKIVI